MHRAWFLAILLSFVVMLNGCDTKTILDHAAPETVQTAKSNVDYLRHGQFDKIEASLDPSIDRANVPADLARMASILPQQEPQSIKTVGAYVTCATRKGCDTRVTLEYQFPSKWILVEMVVHRQNNTATITDFHIEPERDSLDAINRFTLLGKDPVQYAILSTAILFATVMLYALVLCIKTRMEKRKWLWMLFILLGLGQVGVNWTTGETFYKTLYISILPFGFSSMVYGPWMIYISLPVGAVLFLVLRERLGKPKTPEPVATDPPPVSADV